MTASLAQVVLRGLLHLREDHRGDFRGAVALAAQFDPGVAVVARHDPVRRNLDALAHFVGIVLAADEPLHREHRRFRIGDRLALGNLPDEALARLGESNHRGSGTAAFRVRDHHRLAAFHDGDARVRRPEIDADHPRHAVCAPREALQN